MKNIFVATDFSDAAKSATLYGIELAHSFGANMQLFYGSGAPVKLTSPYDPVDAARIIAEAKNKLVSHAASLRNKHKVNIELYVSDGHVPDAIIENATNCQADIIICGMKARGKSMKKIFGSVVYSLVNKTSIPLLVIPEGLKFHKPRHIALAADLDPETSPATLLAMKNIGEKFYSKISVINVLDENFKEQDVHRFQPPPNVSELEHLYPHYEFPVGDNVAETIHRFAVEKHFDVLAIVPHKRKWMSRLVTQSVTRNLIAYTNLPVLVLPQNKNANDDSLSDMEHIHQVWEKAEIKRDEYHC